MQLAIHIRLECKSGVNQRPNCDISITKIYKNFKFKQT